MQNFKEAHSALISRNIASIRTFLWSRLGGDYKFVDDELPYGFMMEVDKAKRPCFTFGKDFGGEEKGITLWRLLEILPIIQKTITRKQGVSYWSLGDEGIPGRVSFCGTSSCVLIADCAFVASSGYKLERKIFDRQPAWSSRSDIPYWRGSTTGYRDGATILDTPRARLCELGRKRDYNFSFSAIEQAYGEDLLVKKSGLLDKPEPWSNLSNYKFNIDIDGNTSSWSGLFRKLLAGGVVIKVDSPFNFKQWYYDRLVPWSNFVPTRSDFADLPEIVEALRKDPAKAEAIGRAGRELACSLTFEREIANSVSTIWDAAGG